MHPHDVHDVQADAGADPGHAAAPGHQVVGLGAVDRVHAAVVNWHDGDTDQEEDHRHGDAVGHVGPRGLWVAENLEEPAAGGDRARGISVLGGMSHNKSVLHN